MASAFYDDLAPFYDLIYPDWEGAMERHATCICSLLPAGRAVRILDLSAGIGTQAIPLAMMGHSVVARDISVSSINRLREEARARGVEVQADVADMHSVAATVDGVFDAIIAFDNSVPHLLTDALIIETFEGLRGLLTDDGNILISTRDYQSVERVPHRIDYGERRRHTQIVRLSQEWTWSSNTRYTTTMSVEGKVDGEWKLILSTAAEYYAISVDHLMTLIRTARLTAQVAEGVDFYQPIIVARAT